MNELYEELETPEGERKISRIAKAKDFTKNNQIKEEHRVLLMDVDRILGRGKGYFDNLLNGDYRRGWEPRRKNCPCDLMMVCASADITDGTARTSIIRHSLMPMIPFESSICHTNLGTTI